MAAPGYLIVQMNISDMARYKEYLAQAPIAVKAFGGEYLVRGGKHETLEGDWNPPRVAVIRFPSYAQAKAFYDGYHYRRVRGLREGATEFFDVVLVEGAELPTDSAATGR